MPAYRYLLFWMRFTGTLTVLTEAHWWRTKDPVSATRDGVVEIFVRREGKRGKTA
jgi:hypothetical protein